jgi:hypothetical protein
MRELFPKMPQHDLDEIIKHAWADNSLRVGTNQSLPLARRIQLATIARIRHMYTDYDVLLKAFGDWEATRAQVERECLQKLKEWRGENVQDETEEREWVQRELIVIDDDEEDDDALTAHHDADDEDSATDQGYGSDTSVEITHHQARAEDLAAESPRETIRRYIERHHLQDRLPQALYQQRPHSDVHAPSRSRPQTRSRPTSKITTSHPSTPVYRMLPEPEQPRRLVPIPPEPEPYRQFQGDFNRPLTPQRYRQQPQQVYDQHEGVGAYYHPQDQPGPYVQQYTPVAVDRQSDEMVINGKVFRRIQEATQTQAWPARAEPEPRYNYAAQNQPPPPYDATRYPFPQEVQRIPSHALEPYPRAVASIEPPQGQQPNAWPPPRGHPQTPPGYRPANYVDLTSPERRPPPPQPVHGAPAPVQQVPRGSPYLR